MNSSLPFSFKTGSEAKAEANYLSHEASREERGCFMVYHPTCLDVLIVNDKMDKRKLKHSARLLEISNSLTSTNLEGLKFLCRDVIPAGRAEKITRPFELFSALEQLNMLSEKNRIFLAAILNIIGRIDLSNKLLQIQGKKNVLSLFNEILCLIFIAKSSLHETISW